MPQEDLATPSASLKGGLSWPYPCVNHPDLPAWAFCGECREKICMGCREFDPTTHTARCPTCFQRALLPEQNATQSEVNSASKEASSGNTQQKKGEGQIPSREPQGIQDYPRALLMLIARPIQFFSAMEKDTGLSKAIFFGIFWSTLATIGAVVLSITLVDDVHPLLQQLETQQAELSSGPMDRNGLIMALAFMIPILSSLQVFLYGGAFHWILRLSGSSNSPSMTRTLKVSAYALAGQIFMLIPSWSMGISMSYIISMALLVIGLRQTHQLSFTRAALVVALPMIILGMLGMEFGAMPETG